MISLFLCVQLSACSRIKSYFPDKEKDYQLTREIPTLSLPPDLKDNAVQFAPAIENATPVYQQNNDITKIDSSAKETAVYVGLVEYTGGATRIRIEDSLQRSWRLVGKALTHHSIEIIDRNEQDHIYFVLYDADFKKIEDGSLWDEVLFIFGSDPANEKEFRLKLADKGALTEVIVLDANDKPLSQGVGLKLLTLLYQTIKQDLSTK